MNSKVVKEKIESAGHRLFKGQSGSIYFELNNGSRVCILGTNYVDIGQINTPPYSNSWKPFYGTIELSE